MLLETLATPLDMLDGHVDGYVVLLDIDADYDNNNFPSRHCVIALLVLFLSFRYQ